MYHKRDALTRTWWCRGKDQRCWGDFLAHLELVYIIIYIYNISVYIVIYMYGSTLLKGFTTTRWKLEKKILVSGAFGLWQIRSASSFLVSPLPAQSSALSSTIPAPSIQTDLFDSKLIWAFPPFSLPAFMAPNALLSFDISELQWCLQTSVLDLRQRCTNPSHYSDYSQLCCLID